LVRTVAAVIRFHHTHGRVMNHTWSINHIMMSTRTTKTITTSKNSNIRIPIVSLADVQQGLLTMSKLIHPITFIDRPSRWGTISGRSCGSPSSSTGRSASLGYDRLQPHQEERQSYAERRDNRWLGIYSGGDVGIKHDHAALVAVKWEEEIETEAQCDFCPDPQRELRRQLGYGNSHMGEPQRFHAGHVRQGGSPSRWNPRFGSIAAMPACWWKY
jgi:hypothetical protein